MCYNTFILQRRTLWLIVFFDDEIKNTYSCEYEIENEKINIEVDFGYADRETLTKTVNENRKIIYPETITIVDEKQKLYIKTFFAFYTRYEITSDFFMRTKKRYYSNSYLKTNILANLPIIQKDSVVSELRVYHEVLDMFYGNKSKDIIRKGNVAIITLDSAKPSEKIIKIKKFNIKEINLYSGWTSKTSEREVHINYFNKLILSFKKPIKLEKLFSYERLLNIMFNGFCPRNKPIYKYEILIDGKSYEFVSKNINYSPDFSLNFTDVIEHNIENYIIKFISKFDIKESDFNLINSFYNTKKLFAEDKFVVYYRFLELSLKATDPDWLENLLKINKPLIKYCGLKFTNKLFLEMVTLRNQYTHEGYFINKHKLSVKKHLKYNPLGYNKVYNSTIIVKFSKLIKLLAYKIFYNDLLSLNLKDNNFTNAIK